MNKLLISIIVGVIILNSCYNFLPLNNAPPSYIKEIVVYKEGSDGIVIYIILADVKGEMTTASGQLNLKITETHNDISINGNMSESNLSLFSSVLQVQKSSFRKTKVGLGAFEHEAILFSIGRVPYSDFTKTPSEITGEVKISFITSGSDTRLLEGKETVIF